MHLMLKVLCGTRDFTEIREKSPKKELSLEAFIPFGQKRIHLKRSDRTKEMKGNRSAPDSDLGTFRTT